MQASRLALLAPLLILAAACADPSIEATTILESTTDSSGPYRVRSVILGANPDDKVEIFYNALDGDPDHYIPLPMNPLDSDGRAGELYIGQMPGQPAGTTIRYFVAVSRGSERVAEDPVGADLRPFVFSIAAD